MGDAEAEFGFGDAHLGEFELDRRGTHKRARLRDDGNILCQYSNLEIIFCEHWDIVVLILYTCWSSHSKSNETIPHKAGPPYAFPGLLFRRFHIRVLGVSMQTNRMCKGNGHAHPMPCIFLVVGSFVPVCHQKKGLDEGYAIDFVVEVVEDLLIQLCTFFSKSADLLSLFGRTPCELLFDSCTPLQPNSSYPRMQCLRT